MQLGIDYLLGANYPKLIEKHHPTGFGAGFMLNTNRPHTPRVNAWPIIEKLAASGACPLIRVHAMWEDSHQYDPKKHDAIIFRELAHLHGMAEKFPGVEFYFSPFCELDTRGASVDGLWNRLEERRGPHAGLVNSVSKGLFRRNCVNEFHGSHGGPKDGPYIYSFDGTQCVDADVAGTKQKMKGAVACFLWTSHFNCKWSADPKKDPTKRDKRVTKPYPELFKSLAAYADDVRPSDVSLSSRHIWKTHADQHGPKRAAREGKPVFISTVDAKGVELRDMHARLVAKMPRMGEYTDGRPLYRLGMFGFQAAELAKKSAGSPMVDLVANGKVIGRVHPAFRAGSFRG